MSSGRIAIIGSGTRSTALPPWFAEQAVVSGFEAFLVTPRLSAFAYSPYERLIVDLGYVDAMQAAASERDCRAIVINSFADYGIDAARAAIEVPIVGAGEAAITAASASGARKFSIVTVWPESMRFLYVERLRALGVESLCVSMRHLSPERELERLAEDDGVMQRMARRESPVIDALRRECMAAIREDGAEAIALGCTCMAPIGPQLAQGVPVPVYESSRLAMQTALALVRGNAVAAPAAHALAARARRNALVPRLVDGGLGALAAPAGSAASMLESEAHCAPCSDLALAEPRS